MRRRIQCEVVFIRLPVMLFHSCFRMKIRHIFKTRSGFRVFAERLENMSEEWEAGCGGDENIFTMIALARTQRGKYGREEE